MTTAAPSTPSRRAPRHTVLASALALSLTALAANAETALDADTTRLDAIVVTASGFEQKITDAPASISVISQEDLRLKRYSDLAEALGDIEGVDISQGTGKTGGLNISIRGMPAAYTLVLIDGRRQNNSGDITPNGFGETSTSFIPPLSAIERIEVIRGPMSTLYGSDAMGGVVNIITRRVAPDWGTALTLDHTLQQNRDYGQSSTANVYSSGPLVRDVLGLAVRGRVFDRSAAELEFDDGSTVSRRGAAAVDGRSLDVGGRLTLTPGEDHEFALDFSRGRQVYNNDNCQLGTLDGRGGNATAGCTPEPNNVAAGYADELRFNRDQVALTHRARLGFGILDSALTHKATETIGRTVPGTIGTPWTGFPDIVGGAPRQLESTDLIFDTRLVSSLGDSHMLTVGGQWIDAEVIDGLTSEQFQQTSWALFVEDEWRLLDNLALTLGGRYEDHEAFGGHFSPRSYLVWTLSDRWTLKGGMGRGYKVPTLNQLHDGINGATAQGATITIGSPHLQPEITTNTEVGIYYDNLQGFNANLTVFQTQFKDVISTGIPVPNCYSANTPDLPGCIDFGPGFTQDSFAQSTNIDEARTSGIELAAFWELAEDWRLSGNYTYSDSEQRSGADAGAPLTNTPRHMLNSRLNWHASDRMDLWLASEYQSGRNRFSNLYANLTPANRAVLDGVGNLRSYNVFHLGGSYRVSDNVSFTATIYNLLDKNFLSGDTYTMPNGATGWASHYTQTAQSITGTIQEGRRLWLSVNIQF